jgi:hypothetical protein
MSVTVADVLRGLAELAPAAAERGVDVTRGGQPLIWLDAPDRTGRGADARRLAAVDALHRDERILRRGWGVLAGTTTVDGATRRVRLPLLTEPVRLERAGRGFRVVPAGDLEVTALVADAALAARLEQAPGIGTAGWLAAAGTRAWLSTVAAATGLPPAGAAPDGPGTPRPPGDRLLLYPRAVLFTVRDAYGVALADSLRAWAGRPGVERSALAGVYGVTMPSAPGDRAGGSAAGSVVGALVSVVATPPPTADHPDDLRVLSPLPLTHAQREVVRRARHEPLTVVCGPPGSGKSHAVVAAALDVVDRGGSVLVATQSPHAADVLADLFARFPGPSPVLFGDAERRVAIAARLAGGPGAIAGTSQLRDRELAVRAARAEVDRLTDQVTAALAEERLAASTGAWEPVVTGLEADAPGAFALSRADLGLASFRIRQIGETSARSARWRRWVAAWRERRVRRALGAHGEVPLARLRDAVLAAAARQAAARLAATGGTDLAATWLARDRAADRLAAALGEAFRDRARSGGRWTPAARQAAGALAAALRAGRNRRREMLAALDGPSLVRALPLWVGTVTDVEDLLPPVPGLFDLVIIDEASHTDQVRAAPVLARARRALVVGDPRQLRFVSFVADVDVAQTLAEHGLDYRVDVRRVSAYDLAARAAPVTTLDVHFRCAPHLIGFSAQRFYGGGLALATRHPRTETTDVIDVVRIPGARSEGGVNADEVDAAIEAVRGLAAAGRTDIGVVTPFRAQADALEAALVAAFPVAEIERIGLRVGTVHAFQGSEADVVVCSLAIVDGDASARVRFLGDGTLFNVMVTRARHGMVVLTSATNPTGLVRDYLEYGERGLAAVVDGEGGDDPWAAALAKALADAGRTVRRRYRSGRWSVDLCVTDGPGEALGVVCGVHPDGPAAHVARREELTRAGWRIVEAFPSRWAGDPVRAALELTAG